MEAPKDAPLHSDPSAEEYMGPRKRKRQGPTRRHMRAEIARDRASTRDMSKVVGDRTYLLHPTKGYRYVNPKRQMAEIIVARIKLGDSWPLERMRRQMRLVTS
jgi:hypothetical protein